MELIKLDCGSYALNGHVNVVEEQTDVKVIDGKKYTHTEREVKSYSTIEWLKKENPQAWEIDISPFGDIHYYKDTSQLTNTFISRYYPKNGRSTNDEINLYLCLHENNVFDSRIRRLYTYSTIHNMFREMIDCVGKTIKIPLIGYGFNNYLMCVLDLEDFLFNIDLKKLECYHELKRLFKRKYLIDLTKPITTEHIIKLLTKKIDETD